MATLENLIQYLSEGTVVLWIGAGASADAGIPGHRALAQRLLEKCRSDQKSNFNSIESSYRAENYPMLFDQVDREYGREFLTQHLLDELKPTSNANVYQLIAGLDVDAYLTTNYEALLYESVSENKAFQRFGNSQSHLSAVELGVTPAVVHIHGDLGQESSIVITQTDYDKWYFKPTHEYYRQFLKSVLGTARILFIGYSLQDPEIKQLILLMTQILRVLSELSAQPRKSPIFTVKEAVNPECANTNGG